MIQSGRGARCTAQTGMRVPSSHTCACGHRGQRQGGTGRSTRRDLGRDDVGLLEHDPVWGGSSHSPALTTRKTRVPRINSRPQQHTCCGRGRAAGRDGGMMESSSNETQGWPEQGKYAKPAHARRRLPTQTEAGGRAPGTVMVTRVDLRHGI
ncbi:hypothetical protein BD413DRAFT_589010 [Trametes elegans]|nr:hypothetical protein BD413DRAFT_589010 [Trametes elegans]